MCVCMFIAAGGGGGIYSRSIVVNISDCQWRSVGFSMAVLA